MSKCECCICDPEAGNIWVCNEKSKNITISSINNKCEYCNKDITSIGYFLPYICETCMKKAFDKILK